MQISVGDLVPTVRFNDGNMGTSPNRRWLVPTIAFLSPHDRHLVGWRDIVIWTEIGDLIDFEQLLDRL